MLTAPAQADCTRGASTLSWAAKQYRDLARDAKAFRTRNDIGRSGTEEEEEVVRYGGIGLKNVRRRLELMYPGQYELSVNSNSASFSVRLTLELSVLQGLPVMHKIA